MIDLRLARPGTSWLDAKLEGHPAGDAPVHVLNTMMAPLRVENGDRVKVVVSLHRDLEPPDAQHRGVHPVAGGAPRFRVGRLVDSPTLPRPHSERGGVGGRVCRVHRVGLRGPADTDGAGAVLGLDETPSRLAFTIARRSVSPSWRQDPDWNARRVALD